MRSDLQRLRLRQPCWPCPLHSALLHGPVRACKGGQRGASRLANSTCPTVIALRGGGVAPPPSTHSQRDLLPCPCAADLPSQPGTMSWNSTYDLNSQAWYIVTPWGYRISAWELVASAAVVVAVPSGRPSLAACVRELGRPDAVDVFLREVARQLRHTQGFARGELSGEDIRRALLPVGHLLFANQAFIQVRRCPAAWQLRCPSRCHVCCAHCRSWLLCGHATGQPMYGLCSW